MSSGLSRMHSGQGVLRGRRHGSVGETSDLFFQRILFIQDEAYPIAAPRSV